MVIRSGERNKRRGMEKDEDRENEGKRLRAKCGRTRRLGWGRRDLLQ